MQKMLTNHSEFVLRAERPNNQKARLLCMCMKVLGVGVPCGMGENAVDKQSDASYFSFPKKKKKAIAKLYSPGTGIISTLWSKKMTNSFYWW